MPKRYTVEFSEGETFYFRFALRDAAGLPLDLTGGLVEWAVAALDGSGTTLLATSANGMITITSATAGEGYVSIAPDDHADIIGGEYTHELRATLADATSTIQITGGMTVAESIFPAIGTGFTRSTGLRLVYDAITADADPGDGEFRFNHATPASATYVYVDLADHYGVSITNWLAVLDDSTTTGTRGFLRFTKVNLESVWYEYAITGAVETVSGYRKVPISYVAGAGTITDGSHFAVTFSRTGDQGSAGVLSDGDKGDIVVSAAGTAWTFDSAVVTTEARTALALTDPGADRVLFWDDSAGSYAHLTMGTNLSISGTTLNSSATGATLADGDYGDITASSSGTVLTIDNDAVTYAKMQNVSATDKLLGRSTSGAGNVEEIDCTAFGRSILDDANEAAFKATVNLEIGTDVQAYDADTLKSDTAANLTAGFTATAYNLGTQTTGTTTPDPDNGNFQRAVNGGAHTLAPPSATPGDSLSMVIQYTNNGSAGTITTSGFTKVSGDSLTTTNGDDFLFYITVCNGFSHLAVTALQ